MARDGLNRRLSTQDAAFLYYEKPKEPLHVGSCMLYEGHLSRDALIHILLDRLPALPRYRQKVVFPPFGLAHPTWEDDPDFDIRNHVEECSLPDPADDKVLSEVGGRLFAPLLNRDRPLWKMILLHGRPDGTTALIWKIHHAMLDGVSWVDLINVLHDLKPAAELAASPAAAWQPQPVPDALSLLQAAMRDQLAEMSQTWVEESFRFWRPTDLVQRIQEWTNAGLTTLPAMWQPAPSTPFNTPLSGARQFVWAAFSFAEMRAVRSLLGGTVNDVVLAVIAGGLGRYLRAHDYTTQGGQLRAMCPVNMRQDDERGALGNRVSMLLVPLFVGITDPLKRLAAQRTAVEELKQQDQAGGIYAMTRLANSVPPAWQALTGQWPMPNLVLNTVSTNVPGPQIPLYLTGHKLLAMYPLGPLSANVGLFNATVSYNQTLTIGATVDPTVMPDAWLYADCLKESFAELHAAARRTAPSYPTNIGQANKTA